MYIVIWEFRVKPEHREQFEEIYSSGGAWADLFGKGTGYRGTDLLQDLKDPQRFLTIDRWELREGYDAFLSEWKGEYGALDAQYEGLIEREARLGAFETIA